MRRYGNKTNVPIVMKTAEKKGKGRRPNAGMQHTFQEVKYKGYYIRKVGAYIVYKDDGTMLRICSHAVSLEGAKDYVDRAAMEDTVTTD